MSGMADHNVVAALVDAVYGAAGDPVRWQTAVDDLQRALGLPRSWLSVLEGEKEFSARGLPRFPAGTRKMFEFVFPHLLRAFRMHELLLAQLQSVRNLEMLVERLATGIVLVNQEGATLFVNSSARQFLSAFGGTFDRAGSLILASSRETQRLRERIRHAVQAALECRTEAPHLLRFGSTDPVRQLHVVVTSVSRSANALSHVNGWVCAIILLSPACFPKLSANQLLQLDFGFTRAECVLAAHVVEGKSLRTIASELSLSKETLRVQLKGLFRKTGTRSQPELIRLLAQEPSALLGDETLSARQLR